MSPEEYGQIREDIGALKSDVRSLTHQINTMNSKMDKVVSNVTGMKVRLTTYAAIASFIISQAATLVMGRLTKGE